MKHIFKYFLLNSPLRLRLRPRELFFVLNSQNIRAYQEKHALTCLPLDLFCVSYYLRSCLFRFLRALESLDLDRSSILNV